MINNLEVTRLEINDPRLPEVIKFLSEESFEYYSEIHLKGMQDLDDKKKSEIKQAFLEAQTENFISFNGIAYAAYTGNKKLIGAALRCDNYLDALFVNKAYRNQKVGGRLIERLLQDCMEYQIISLDASVKAVSLYQRYGFKKNGTPKNKYVVPMKLERSHHEK